jgi:hypothetical protein
VHCRKVAHSITKFIGIEGTDYIVCPICKIRTRQISPKHAKMHGFDSAKHMQEFLKMPLITCELKKESSVGENNPGYHHGGKFSHFSKNFIHGYDEEKHNKLIENNRLFRIDHPELFKTDIAYWLKQTNGDEVLAKQLYMKFQMRDLNWFIKKYGEDEGKIRHQNKIDKWINTLKSKPLEELLDINKRRNTCGPSSKSERELFDKLSEFFPNLIRQLLLRRENINGVFNKFYLYDMALSNKIIEYNGDYWHANPAKYDSITYVNKHNNQAFSEIRARDEDKLQVAIDNGYSLLTIWESDYKLNSKKVIEQCIQFLNQ